MKIKVLSLETKPAIYIAVYYLAIFALLALLGTIVLRFVFSPPCSVIGKNECIVDGWSVAGLASTVLAVAATLLAILGAIAVAGWWLNLNDKVDRRVDEQAKKAIDQAYQEQVKEISQQTTQLLEEQKKRFEAILSTQQKDMDNLKALTSNIENSAQEAIKQLVIAMTQQYPWIVETWAIEYIAIYPTSEVAARMMRRYLQIVDGFFSNDQKDVSAHLETLKNISAPYDTPIGYWNKALEWQKMIRNKQQAEVMSDELGKRRANIEAWKLQHNI
ncbi:MAG TPA: hypothetical protein VNG51_29205 [Ktedonobacteraceae bacterium]|nr:hypothetical protein [Ktedonobacteraceae bacterium]